VWGSVGVLALMLGLHPVRLGLILLVISRPRPVQNLLAFTVGCVIGVLPAVVVPLTLVHFIPTFASLAQHSVTPAASATVRHIQFGAGVLALSIAALITARSLTRRRQRAQLPTSGGATSTLVLDSNTPTVISRLLGHAQDVPNEGASAFRRLLRRIHNAWENGSLWVAFLIGLGFGGAPPDVGLTLVAVIVASGAAIGTQVIAVIAFVVGMLALHEIVLVGYLATPVKTQKVMGVLHDWTWTHRRKIMVAMFSLIGVSMIAMGMGGV
jgi:hypothetical protein